MTAASMQQLIDTKSVIVCMGPGGVGKTTAAAALAVGGAMRGLRVVVLTVDPARRLAEAMGLAVKQDHGGQDGADPVGLSGSDPVVLSGSDPVGLSGSDPVVLRPSRELGRSSGLSNQPRRIPGPWEEKGGQLWGVMLDPRATFDDLITEHARSPKQRETILGNRLYQNLTTTLAGTNEYMAAERLRSLHADARFDLVVLDTPPAHHAIEFLDSPGRLSRFVDHRVYRTLLAPRPGVLRAMTSAANVVVRAIGQVVGSTLLADAIEFFNEFQGMDKGFRNRAAEIDEVLQSEETAYVLISSPRYEPLRAAGWIIEQLAQRNRQVDALIVNRMTPDFWPFADAVSWTEPGDAARRERPDDRPTGDQPPGDGSTGDGAGVEPADTHLIEDPLTKNLGAMLSLRRVEEQLILDAMGSEPDAIRVLLDEQADSVTDLDALKKLGKALLTN